MRADLWQGLDELDDREYAIRVLAMEGVFGGWDSSCAYCRFASKPLGRLGHELEYHEYSNDETEAHFRCSMPGRDHEEVFWGEYAPCTREEWVELVVPTPPPKSASEIAIEQWAESWG